MTPEIAQFTNRGMNQDISISKATNEFAFKNHNIRITAINDNTLLSITNEKLPGDIKVDVTGRKRVPNKVSVNKTFLNNYKISLEYPPTKGVRIKVLLEDGTTKVITIRTPNNISTFTAETAIAGVEFPLNNDPNFIYYYGDEVPEETEIKYNHIYGQYLGHTILNEYLVLFTKTSTTDYIYVFTYDDTANTLIGNIKYEGSLNFSLEHPIETLPYYESEEVQKVYWVDGLNQPRVINIVANDIVERLNTQFDFNPTVTKFPNVTINKEYQGVGLFPAGVIQYFISYYNKFGAETGIVWSSDLQYVTEYNRGASPSDNVVCNFKIDVNNIDTTYDYMRVYSMQRTSLNNTPICRIVADVNINKSDNLTVLDTNTNTETIDPTQLLFLGGDTFIASTLTQKDDVLFLGDLEVDNVVVPQEVKDLFDVSYDKETYKSNLIKFEYKTFSNKEFQLHQSESSIKTFKEGEIYRFALQFQDVTSKWTTPIWIGDATSFLKPTIEGDNISVATAVLTLEEDVKSKLEEYYTNYRLLIAEPTNADRRILAQGIVAPTVFNYEQRANGTGPYSQASWILRPRNSKVAFEHLEGLGNKVSKNEEGDLEFYNLPTCEIQNSLNKLPGKLGTSTTQNFIISIYTKNYYYEYTILKISGTSLTNFGEIEEVIGTNYIATSNVEEATEWLIEELIEKLSLSDTADLGIDETKLEEAFYNINYTTTDTDTAVEDTEWYYGFMAKQPGGTYIPVDNGVSYTLRYGGIKRIISSSSNITDTSKEYQNNFYVDSSIVTFHSPELENNTELFEDADLVFNIIGIAPINNTTSKISLKVNPSGYSGTSGVINTTFLDKNAPLVNAPLFQDNAWTDEGVLNLSSKGLYYIYLWNKKGSIIGQTQDSKKESSIIGGDPLDLETQYAILENKIIANRYYSNSPVYFYDRSYDIKPTVFNSDQLTSKLLHTSDKEVIYQGNYDFLSTTTLYKSLSSKLNYYKSFWQDSNNFDIYAEEINQVDPVSIKYKTLPHLVFELSSSIGKHTLPTLNSSEVNYYDRLIQEYGDVSNLHYPWIKNSDINAYIQVEIQEPTECDLPYFYIGEVCRKFIDSSKIYGGVSEDALERINWIPASNSALIQDNITNSFGDTYFQRWDCLHSYPFTREDQNSVIDIASFMVETHYNIEGRYDKNKLLQELLSVNAETYTKINPVYSQTNNYFTYNILDEKFNATKYENQVTFSLTKIPTSEIDTWCNITLTSAFSLNGLYGKLNKLATVNDTIVAFQDKALSVINFNNRTAISTENGVPIEIANSGKVDGYTIISSNVGCQNKQSICDASSGVYFIDDLNKTMYGFNKEGISNISAKGMSMWFKKNLTGKEKTFYDSLTNDVYVTNANDCLVFNEGLQSFISFMDYNNINALFNFNGYSLMLDKDEQDAIIPKKMFSGGYTNNYSIEYKINPEPLIDKTFSNIEFIADCISEQDFVDSDVIQYNGNIKPFDLLQVWNEYQRGSTNLHTTRFRYPNSEKKFRIWRIDVPRDDFNHRDRIRNPWIYLRLSKSEDLQHTKMVFHNLLVKYYK